ncbi:hypothetical protein D9M68_544070 [compost metagenome]
MDDLDLVVVSGGMQAVLPAGRGNGCVAVLQVQQVQRVATVDARGTIQGQRELGIKACIRSIGAVVVLAEMDQLAIGESLLGIKSFTPAGVRDDHIRAVALGLEIEQQAKYLLAMQHTLLEGTRIGMGLLAGLTVWAIAIQAYTRKTRCVFPTNSTYIDAWLPSKMSSDMAELARKVLVDKKHIHVQPSLGS